MHEPMSAAAKHAACQAVKEVLEARYPGTIWMVVPEGEKPPPGVAVFRIKAPDPYDELANIAWEAIRARCA